MTLEKESVWNVVQRSLIKNARTVIILKNNFYVCLNTEKNELIFNDFKISDFNNKLNFSSIPF